MKKEDLRIGNLCHYKVEDSLDERKEWNEENIIDARDLVAISQCEQAKKESNFSPILLTAEWLVKFGFKLIHEANKHYAIQNPNGYKDLHKIHFFPTINEQWHLAFSDSTSGKDETYIPASHIKYVHELQNVYYAITKRELAVAP